MNFLLISFQENIMTRTSLLYGLDIKYFHLLYLHKAAVINTQEACYISIKVLVRIWFCPFQVISVLDSLLFYVI